MRQILDGKFSDEDANIMTGVYNYIPRKTIKNFGDEMWIHNCYNSILCMKSFEQPDPDFYVSQPKLTDNEFRDFQEAMNHTIYKNLIETDSVMKEDKDYSFAIMPTDECDLLSYTSDDNRELAHTEATVDKKNMICNKFNE